MTRKAFVFVGLVSILLIIGFTLTGFIALGGVASGATGRADTAAQSLIGQNVDVLLAAGLPTYSQTSGRIERYAFRDWVVRKASGEEGIDQPSVILTGGTMFIFTISSDGIITSYEKRVEQESYFRTWEKTGT